MDPRAGDRSRHCSLSAWLRPQSGRSMIPCRCALRYADRCCCAVAVTYADWRRGGLCIEIMPHVIFIRHNVCKTMIEMLHWHHHFLRDALVQCSSTVSAPFGGHSTLGVRSSDNVWAAIAVFACQRQASGSLGRVSYPAGCLGACSAGGQQV